MYILDFFKKLGRKSNIPIIIYLILNIFIITGIVTVAFALPGPIGFLVAIILYLVSLMIALSPIGEFMLRMQTGCKKIKRVEIKEFIYPIFEEVYEKAKQLDPSIPDDVKLYMNEDKSSNAFATGRKTICITNGMLEENEEYIKATLAHEFGHLAHHDTDLILIVSVGNMIITACVLFVRMIIRMIYGMFWIMSVLMNGWGGVFERLGAWICQAMITATIGFVMWVWTKIGTLLIMKSSRGNEFEADEFAFNLGYGVPLCEFFDTFTDGERPNGLFANLVSSHPDTNDRIYHLQELGCEYRSTKYGNGSKKPAGKKHSVNTANKSKEVSATKEALKNKNNAGKEKAPVKRNASVAAATEALQRAENNIVQMPIQNPVEYAPSPQPVQPVVTSIAKPAKMNNEEMEQPEVQMEVREPVQINPVVQMSAPQSVQPVPNSQQIQASPYVQNMQTVGTPGYPYPQQTQVYEPLNQVTQNIPEAGYTQYETPVYGVTKDYSNVQNAQTYDRGAGEYLPISLSHVVDDNAYMMNCYYAVNAAGISIANSFIKGGNVYYDNINWLRNNAVDISLSLNNGLNKLVEPDIRTREYVMLYSWFKKQVGWM